jgi:hypothetical protein
MARPQPALRVRDFERMLVAGSNTITTTFDASHNSLQKLPAARKLASDGTGEKEMNLKRQQRQMVKLSVLSCT